MDGLAANAITPTFTGRWTYLLGLLLHPHCRSVILGASALKPKPEASSIFRDR